MPWRLLHKLVQCVSIRSLADNFPNLQSFFVCWWWESCGLNRTGNRAPLHEAASGAKLPGAMTFMHQGKNLPATAHRGGGWNLPYAGHTQQLSWCFSQAPHSREYKWRNWDMTFSLTGKVSADNEWTSLWPQAMLRKKETNFKCHGNKNTPSLHSILSLNKCSACF